MEYKDTKLRFFALHPASVRTRLGDPSQVTTPELLEKSPAMQQMLTQFYPMLKDKVELPAYTALFLAHPDGRADLLKRIDVVKKKQMYSLKADMFTNEHDIEMRKRFKRERSPNRDSKA